jgi:hypothetical protein
MSAASRNIVCAGAVAMCSMVDGTESEAAAWGTACHEIAEHCLYNEVDADVFIGEIKTVGRFTFEVDDEMAETAQVYIDHCVEEIEAEQCFFWIEEKLTLASLKPAMEAGGTGDLVLYRPGSKTLKIKDLKSGRGVYVDVKNNAQERGYALMALLGHADLDVETIETAIIQPRLAKDGDGGIRSETFHIAELYEWASDVLLPAIARSAAAKAEFEAIQGNRVKFDEWAAKWLRAGACTFCDAKPLCPKFRGEALAALPERAAKWFETPSDDPLPNLSNAAMLLSPEELAHALNGLELVEAWAKAVRERGHAQAEAGVKLPGWKLVEKIGNRAWIDKAEAETALAAAGVPEGVLHIKKLISPAQAEKALGKKRVNLIDGLWEKPKRGLSLVREETDKPAVVSKASLFFESP